LYGSAAGAAIAGLDLGLKAACFGLSAIPRQALVSIDLPIFGANSNPYASGIILAGTLALLLAFARRLPPARWALAMATVATVLAVAMPDFQPFELAARLLFIGLLTFVYYRWGLAALLTAAMTTSLLPGAAFSALHLSWLPWTFAVTAGSS